MERDFVQPFRLSLRLATNPQGDALGCYRGAPSARWILARIIHKLPAAEPPSLALVALPPLGLLGIVHDYACGALARKALPARTLRPCASAPYELCGLATSPTFPLPTKH